MLKIFTKYTTGSVDSFALEFFAFLLMTPFYFVWFDGGFTFAPLLAFDYIYTKVSFGIPVVLAGIVLLGLLFIYRFANRQISFRQLPAILALALIVWMTAVLLFGLKEKVGLTFAIYMQTALPIMVLVILLTHPFSPSTMKRALLIIPIVGALSIVLQIGTYIYLLSLHRPYTAFSYLAEAYYATKNIFPVIVAAGLTIILWQFSRARRDLSPVLLWILFVIHAAYILIIWSRSGMFSIGLLFGMWLTIEVFRKKWTKKFAIERLILTVIMLSMAVTALRIGGISLRQIALTPAATHTVIALKTKHSIQFASIGPHVKNLVAAQFELLSANTTTQKKKILTQTEMEELVIKGLKSGDSRRLLLIKGGIKRILASPITGDSFNALPPGTIVAGKEVKSHKVYPSHNQFIDIAIRAGLPAVILYSILLLVLAIRLWKGFRNGSELALVALYFLITVMFANMFQTYFMVTQSAVVIFLLVVMAIRFTEEGQNVRSEKY